MSISVHRGMLAFTQSDEQTVNLLRRFVRNLAQRNEVSAAQKLSLGKLMYALAQLPAGTQNLAVHVKISDGDNTHDRPFCSLNVTSAAVTLRSGVLFSTGEGNGTDVFEVSQHRRKITSQLDVEHWFRTVDILLQGSAVALVITEDTKPHGGWTKLSTAGDGEA